jgi:integrase
MPRPSKGPYLMSRRARTKKGRTIARAVFIIRDGDKHIATGCFKGEIEQANIKLAEYIGAKYQPSRDERGLDQIPVADVLSIYFDDCGDGQANQRKFKARITRLNEFWGGKTLKQVSTATCRAYANWRGNTGGARRDLEDLRAAIGHHAKDNLHRTIVNVWLPDKGAPRDRWLTRSEAAHLLWTCWRYRETQTLHRGKHKGEKVNTDKRSLRHLARFILIGLYTGTRASAIASASPYRDEGRSFVDLERGIFYRLAIGKRATKKRQTPVPLPPRLLAHMRRWRRCGLVTTHFVEWNGNPVKSVKTAFRRAVKLAKLSGKVTPHTLRHTAATWLMNAGVSIWDAAGFLGMSAKVVEDTYGHHHPDYLQEAAAGITRKQDGNVGVASQKRKGDVSVVELVVETSESRGAKQNPLEYIGGPGRTRTSNQTVMSGRL